VTTRPAASIYDSPRLAAGYAFGRPPVHQAIVKRIASDLGITAPVALALDIGCGAGLSAAALQPIATTIVGVEPIATMLAHGRRVFPRGLFTIGRAEELPFRDRAFDLITAAGSINYVEPNAFLRNVARVLGPEGRFVIYDFADGKRFGDNSRLQQWYDVFERRYPAQRGYALDLRGLPFSQAGLRLDACDEFQVAISMTADSYVRYAMSQTSVELAIARGAREDEIEAWCRATLKDVFGGESHDVIFDATVVHGTHAG
jgi:ubiquinone/menaquinone biosynthesis C-methylase UbiE